jgi:hypothetical protein
MPSPNLIELMSLYARRGIADWNQAHSSLRLRASRCLGTAAIAENEAEAGVTIQTLYHETNANRLRFIPMPKHPKKGIDRCFFLPVRQRQTGGDEIVAFELLLLVQQTDCLAFRFEPAHQRPGHNYGHMQLSRSMLRETIQVGGIPPWVPDTHPAFPVLTAEPLKVFLCMVTAVHGYEAGCTAVLQDIFAGRPGELAMYLNILKTMLV